MRVASVLIVSCLLFSTVGKPTPSSASRSLSARHDESMEHIDEAEVLEHHDPDPISYYQYDYEDAQPELSPDELTQIRPDVRHGGLMTFHAIAMTISYLMVLPIHIVMSAASHRLRWLSQTSFWALNLLGWSAGRAYRRSTPDLYQGSTHGKSGAVLMLLAAIITALDLLPLLRPVRRKVEDLHLAQYFSRPKWMPNVPSWRFWTRAHHDTGYESEYLPVTHSPEAISPREATTPMEWKEDPRDEIDMPESSGQRIFRPHPPTFSSNPSHSVELSREQTRLLHRHSLGSDHSTLHEDHLLTAVHRPVRKVGSRLFAVAKLARIVIERSLVIYGWGQVLSGLTIYWGFGRAQYINGILAHFIKGSIFWWYGILTYARYLGAWSRWGWGWNDAPERAGFKPLSASSVESLVVFIYGFSQQFMERFGKHPGDPYTAKDIEHISIAVMFWGGGLVGLAVESPTVRRWLLGESVSDEAIDEKPSIPHKGDQPPRSSSDTSRWTAANPLPAVVIGITGIAMSAHHQTYLFQIQIHALWGYLLLGFAICRSLTCFFDWVRPRPKNPRIPSLPPTELIGSIFLGAGGFVFLCSDEQIGFWAMRTHRDDVMMFLNLAIAFTCVAYVWTTAVLLVAGRTARRPGLHL